MILFLRVLPAFRMAVEQRDRPELRSCSAVLVDSRSGRSVAEATIPAQRAGVHPGMSLIQARHHCPDLLVLAPDESRYSRVWQEMEDLLRAYTPLVEPLRLGEALCDLTGSERFWPGPQDAARAIGTSLETDIGVNARFGLAANRLVAEIASRTLDSASVTLVPTGSERTFLAPLPLSLLPGIDARLALTFQILGLRTIGQFAALPARSVQERFGIAGKRLHEAARGLDNRPVIPPLPRPIVSARVLCEDGSIEEAVALLERLAVECGTELREHNLSGRMLDLTLQWGPDLPVSRPLPLPQEEDGARALPQNTGEVSSLSLPARIHSRIPQPGHTPVTPTTIALPDLPAPIYHPSAGPERRTLSAVLRVPLTEAAPLAEHGRRLLLEGWREGKDVYALTLTVSEFEAPRQLIFAEMNRLEWTGGLEGTGRIPVIQEQEAALTARYGSSPFRHLVHLDLNNALAERRFRWEDGLNRARRQR